MADDTPVNVNERLKDAISHIFNFKKEKIADLVGDLQLEKRESDRKPYCAEVCYTDNKRIAEGFIQNISEGGISIEPDGPFAKGQIITLTFTHPSGESFIKITGKIVRKDGKGLGIKFSRNIDNLPPEDLNRTSSSSNRK